MKKTIKAVMYKHLLGEKVLVRGFDAGVFMGKLTAVSGDVCRLESARNIEWWDGPSELHTISTTGVESATVSCKVKCVVINGICQIVPLEREAELRLLECARFDDKLKLGAIPCQA